MFENVSMNVSNLLLQVIRLHEALDAGSEGLALLLYQFCTLQFILGRLNEARQLCERSAALGDKEHANKSDQVSHRGIHALSLKHVIPCWCAQTGRKASESAARESLATWHAALNETSGFCSRPAAAMEQDCRGLQFVDSKRGDVILPSTNSDRQFMQVSIFSTH